MLYLESRSMMDNLLYLKIPETTDKSPGVTEKNPAILFVKITLKMDVNIFENIKFDRVQRISRSRVSRVIVAKFNKFQ